MTKESDDENDRIRQGTSQVNVNSQSVAILFANFLSLGIAHLMDILRSN